MAIGDYENEYDDDDFDAIIAGINHAKRVRNHAKNARDAQRSAALAERCQQRDLLLDTIKDKGLMRSVSHILEIRGALVSLCKDPDNPYKLDSDPYMIERVGIGQPGIVVRKYGDSCVHGIGVYGYRNSDMYGSEGKIIALLPEQQCRMLSSHSGYIKFEAGAYVISEDTNRWGEHYASDISPIGRLIPTGCIDWVLWLSLDQQSGMGTTRSLKQLIDGLPLFEQQYYDYARDMIKKAEEETH